MGAGPSTMARQRRLNRGQGQVSRAVYGQLRKAGCAVRQCLRPWYQWFKGLRIRKRVRLLCTFRNAGSRRGTRIRRVGTSWEGGPDYARLSVTSDAGDFINEEAVLERQRKGEWSLIPGLPHEVAIQCLARVPRVNHCALRSVCKPWRWVVETEEFLQLRRDLGCTEDWLYLHVGTSPRLEEGGREKGGGQTQKQRWRLLGGFSQWHAVDPYQYRWYSLPPIPYDSTITGGHVVLGASSVVLDGKLYVIGGAPYGKPALRDVWVYSPLKNRWRRASSMATPRFGALIGVIKNKLYVVGGSGICHLTGYSLPCLEVYDPDYNTWKFAASARGIATNYPCNPLKYVAVVENKLFVIGPQSMTGRINSGVYDPVKDNWSEISPGLRMGWGKPSTVMDGNLYTVDFGSYQQYVAEEDVWMSMKGPTPNLSSSFITSSNPCPTAGSASTSLEWDPRLVSTMAGGNGKLYMVGTMGPALIVVVAPVQDGTVSQGVRWHTMNLPNGVDSLGDLSHCACQVIGF